MSGDDYDDLMDAVQQALGEAGLQLDSPELMDELRNALDQLGGAATPDGKPTLRVVDPDEPAESPPKASVRTVTLTRPARVLPPASDTGRITVADQAWQTVFRGAQPRAYRLAVAVGGLDIAVDGELVERIGPGQTVDVEGALVRVRGAGASSGTYVRL